MGCAGSGADGVKLNKKRQTVFGVLQVKVVEALIEHQTSTVFTMDPYVSIKFSNQQKSGTVVKKGGKNPKFTDIFQFIVNSCYKFYGRCLEIELLDSNTAGIDSLIGYGIIDLDPYLNALQVKSPESSPGKKIEKQPQAISLRCFLNYDRKQAGFIMLSASFREEPVDVINFRFETAQFKRSTRTFGDMNCCVRVTAGEEVLQTKKIADTKTAQPVWKDEHLTFVCPASITNIVIEVVDQDDVIGSITMNKQDFVVDKTKEQQFAREIMHKNEVAGKLKFNTILNYNPFFKELNGDYRKKTPQELLAAQNKPGEEKKPQGQGKKPEGEEKKPQEKKPQEKKPEEKKPQQKKPQEKKPQQKKPQQKRPEQKKPQESKPQQLKIQPKPQVTQNNP